MSDESYLVRAWGATGAPYWEHEPPGAGARSRLTKPNRRDLPLQRLAVYAVPAAQKTAPLAELVAAAEAGRLPAIFADRALIDAAERAYAVPGSAASAVH